MKHPYFKVRNTGTRRDKQEQKKMIEQEKNTPVHVIVLQHS